MLDRVHRAGQIREFSILNQETSFPTEEARQHLAETLRRFAVSHHVRLGRVFGSRKYGFSYPPWQFFLIFEDKELREVFPCRVGDHEVDPTGFLESLLSETAWTLASGPPGRRTKHRELVEQLARNPEIL